MKLLRVAEPEQNAPELFAMDEARATLASRG
jgi:hypothetical protein